MSAPRTDLTISAYTSGIQATRQLDRHSQKHLGQFITPVPIAKAMAIRACLGLDKAVVRVLDPASGSGVLAAAVFEELLRSESRPQEIQVVLCEIDSRLEPSLLKLAQLMRAVGKRVKVRVSVSIRIGDFLLSGFASDRPQFDVVIANPPYFKLNKSDVRSVKHDYAVYGQPNIYGLFMAACSRVLLPEGRWCFITPRSWTNGAYFEAVRRQLLLRLRLDAIHVFESRKDHFTDDEVLQEAMITWASARMGNTDTIVVTCSNGVSDVLTPTLRVIPACEVISNSAVKVISLPTIAGDGLLNSFPARFSTFGMKVSTGPVVAFRATDHIQETNGRSTVPLLWMQHVRRMSVCWPISKKQEYIRANAATAWMMVPNSNMVLMRRFSPKEDVRRVTAAPYFGGTLPGDVIGLENHMNYIYRPSGELSPDEVKGLSAYLNSQIVDAFLRNVAGNTQVNASDLRALPLPTLSTLVAIGKRISADCSLERLDEIVYTALGVRVAAEAAS
jgi:adenine-specific DNA-methyltransferase